MKLLILSILGALAIMFAIDFENRPRVVVYDCSIAEISPDYPVEVKEQCRKLRIKKL